MVLTRRFPWALIAPFAAILALAGLAQTAPAAQPDDIGQAIAIVKTDDPKGRVDAATLLIDNWTASLPLLIDEIDFFGSGGSGQPFTDRDIPTLVSLTDVLRAIVVNQDGAIKSFRANDAPQTARLLVWASRSANRSLRLNATFILANVADNTNLCIILHHLRDPSLTADGMVNLIQVAATVASYAYKENVAMTNATIEIVRDRVAKSDSPKTVSLLDALAKRAAGSSNAGTPLPRSLSYCASYDIDGPL